MPTRYFIEADFDSTEMALQARDQFQEKLSEQGIDCRALVLYRATDGVRLFVVETVEAEQPSEREEQKPRKPRMSRRARREQVEVK